MGRKNTGNADDLTSGTTIKSVNTSLLIVKALKAGTDGESK